MIIQGTELVARIPPAIARMHIRGYRNAQFCPYCLSNNPYHRLSWSIYSVTVCLEHESLLIDHCPQCDSEISISSVIKCACDLCGFDLRRAQPISVKEDVKGIHSQHFVQYLLKLLPTLNDPLNGVFPEEEPDILFRLIDGLRHCIVSPNKERQNIRNSNANGYNFNQYEVFSKYIHEPLKEYLKMQNPPNTLLFYFQYSIAVQALNDWPNSFYEFLSIFRNIDVATKDRGLLNLGNLYSIWIRKRWRNKDFEFLHKAFLNFIENPKYKVCHAALTMSYYRKNPLRFKRFDYMTCAEAARVLKVCSNTVERLAKLGKVSEWRYPTNNESINLQLSKRDDSCEWIMPKFGHYKLVKKSDIYDLKARWDASLPLPKASTKTGVSKNVLLELMKMGVIVASRMPLVDGDNIWLIENQSLNKLLKGLAKSCRRIEKLTPNHVRLSTASRMTAVIGISLAEIVTYLVKGELVCYAYSDNPKFEEVFVLKEDIEEFIKQKVLEKGLVRKRHVARLMRVRALVLSKWISQGLLKTIVIKNALYIYKNDIVEFKNKFIFAKEASRILKVSKQTVQIWAHNGRLKPVSGLSINGCRRYLFYRADIERLRPENRLTAPQMARRLGISNYRIREWIRTGKIIPVSGPGIDHSSHYLFVQE